MNTKEFLSKISEELELSAIPSHQTIIRDLEEWDSLTVISMIAFIADNYSRELTAESLEEIETFGDLIDFLGDEISD